MGNLSDLPNEILERIFDNVVRDVKPIICSKRSHAFTWHEEVYTLGQILRLRLLHRRIMAVLNPLLFREISCTILGYMSQPVGGLANALSSEYLSQFVRVFLVELDLYTVGQDHSGDRLSSYLREIAPRLEDLTLAFKHVAGGARDGGVPYGHLVWTPSTGSFPAFEQLRIITVTEFNMNVDLRTLVDLSPALESLIVSMKRGLTGFDTAVKYAGAATTRTIEALTVRVAYGLNYDIRAALAAIGVESRIFHLELAEAFIGSGSEERRASFSRGILELVTDFRPSSLKITFSPSDWRIYATRLENDAAASELPAIGTTVRTIGPAHWLLPALVHQSANLNLLIEVEERDLVWGFMTEEQRRPGITGWIVDMRGAGLMEIMPATYRGGNAVEMA